jgi:CHAT domain-containing protein
LTARIQRFRDALAARDLAVAGSARELHRVLLGPAREALAGRSRLVVVPDGPLWELPFAALAPGPGRYLLDDAAIALAPSLTTLIALEAARPAATSGDRLFALGNPSDPELPPLPETERQVLALARLYGPARSAVRLRGDAREAAVKAQAGAFSILHFAMHGEADDASPMYSSLRLAREPEDAAEDGRLEAHELIQLPLRADLAVLSACETGRGRVGGGEGMIGLSWAFLVAGARNAVVSHWRVDAASTEALMIGLHRRLLEGRGERDASVALRAAARAVRADPRFRHPFYWAGFSLVGSGRLSAD